MGSRSQVRSRRTVSSSRDCSSRAVRTHHHSPHCTFVLCLPTAGPRRQRVPLSVSPNHLRALRSTCQESSVHRAERRQKWRHTAMPVGGRVCTSERGCCQSRVPGMPEKRGGHGRRKDGVVAAGRHVACREFEAKWKSFCFCYGRLAILHDACDELVPEQCYCLV